MRVRLVAFALMSLSTDTALALLADTALTLGDSGPSGRLSEVRSVLGDGLTWVEQALRETTRDGVEPARSAAEHLLAHGGKRVRPTAALLSAACFGRLEPAVYELALVVELVHSSTLLHDDVIDEGSERRGVPTSRLLWGNAVSVLAGDVLLVHSLKRVLAIAPELMSDLLETLTALVSGEVVQLRGRTNVDITEETYEHILRNKTASLFRFSTASAARLAGANEGAQAALGAFGEDLGMAFQLIDDVLDYTGVKTGKTLCADLRDGKVTLPLVLAAQSDPSLRDAVTRVHAGDDTGIESVQRRVVSSGACDEVRRRAQQNTERALAALNAVPESAAKRLLSEVARKLTARTV